MKKISLMIVALFLAVSLFAGCGGTTSTDDTSPAVDKEKTKQTDETADTATDTIAAENEYLEFSLGGWGIGVSEIDLDRVPQLDFYEDKFNIRFHIEAEMHDGEKVNAAVAANDLPDVFVSHKSNLVSVIPGNMIHPLDDYVTPETAPNIYKYGEAALDFSRAFYSDDSETLYVIPNHISDGAAAFLINPYMRWDYYQEIGTPEINTFDDLIDAMLAAKELHPTNENGEEYYGMALTFDQRLWSYCVPFGFMIDGQHYRDTYLLDYNIVTDTYSKLFTDEDSSLWNAARVLNKMHRNGLLDPEVFSMTSDNLMDRLSLDRYLTTPLSWHQGIATLGLKDMGIDTEFVPMYAGKESSYVSTYREPVGSVAYLWSVANQVPEEQIPRLVEFFDYCYTPEGNRNIIFGLEGKAWEELENGKAKFTDEFKRARQGADYSGEYGSNMLGGLTGLGPQFLVEETGQFIDLSLDKELAVAQYTEIEKEYCEHFGIESMLEPIENCKGYVHDSSATNVLPDLTSDQSRMFATLENHVITNLPDLILNSASETELEDNREALLDELREMGLDEYEDFWMEKIGEAQTIEREIVRR